MARACSPSYSGSWGRRIPWTQKAELAVSQDHPTALQPGRQSETPSPKKKEKKSLREIDNTCSTPTTCQPLHWTPGMKQLVRQAESLLLKHRRQINKSSLFNVMKLTTLLTLGSQTQWLGTGDRQSTETSYSMSCCFWILNHVNVFLIQNKEK